MGVNYYVGNNTYGNDLYHYGIKGQKWGIRRFQNEDGSLTEAGIRRYQSGAEAGFMTPKRMKEARKELGLEKSWFKRDRGERLYTRVYANTKKSIDKQNKKIDKAKERGNQEKVRMGSGIVKSLTKELGALKRDFKKYEKLDRKERIKLNAGAAIVDGLSTAGILLSPANSVMLPAAFAVGGNLGVNYFDRKMLSKIRNS